MIHLAFYKAKGDLMDTLIRLADGRMDDFRWAPATYSHVEIIVERQPMDRTAWCVGASKRDKNRVRRKRIHLDEDRWDILQVQGDFDRALRYVDSQAEIGRRYSNLKAALSITPIDLGPDICPGIFCTELVGNALAEAGVVLPRASHILTPDELFGDLVGLLLERAGMLNPTLMETAR